MVILSYKTIKDFITKHPDVEDQLNNWYLITEQADWAYFNELREIFPSVAPNLTVMPNRKPTINTTQAYNAAMKKIDALMKIGDDSLTDAQADELRTLARAAQAWEKSQYVIPAPKTLEGLIELKMYEQKLKQKELAKKLGVGEAKLSQILSRKRKPDVTFLKAAHKVLGIDGNVLLEFA